MKGCEVYNNALSLLGYAENSGNNQLTNRVMNRALPIINLVNNDLRLICGMEEKRIETLSEEIKLPQKAIDVLICGVAGYVAMAEGDDGAHAIWSAEYQARRTKLSRIEEINDVLPVVE